MSASGKPDSGILPASTVLQMQQAFKLALSMSLMYGLALWMNWDLPKYGALAIALISLDTTGASLTKGLMRIAGTTFGLLAGLVGLALFAQNSMMTLGYHICILIFVSYFMQASRYPYAWYVAGFLPSLVWATTYGVIENAFSYAVFRYLETTAGVVIYTAVSSLLWPRRAGDALSQQGAEFWEQFQKLFDEYRQQLRTGMTSADVANQKSNVVGGLTKLTSTLQAAYADTPSVASKKAVWERLRTDLRAMVDALELWQQSIDTCHRLAVDRQVVEIKGAIDQLQQRFTCIAATWKNQAAHESDRKPYDQQTLIQKVGTLKLDDKLLAELTHLDRAALLSFVQQLNLLQKVSAELLETMRVIDGHVSERSLEASVLPKDLYRPSLWDPFRLIAGLNLAISFSAAWLFWVYCNPPTGPSIPNMVATFGLMLIMQSITARVLVMPMLIATVVFVAPIYFFILPRLSTGLELLAFVFAFSFSLTMLMVGRLAPLRGLVLVLFVMLTGISNQQTYSFNGIVDGGMMQLMALGILVVVQPLVSALKPEQILLENLRRFFRGCALYASGYSSGRSRVTEQLQAQQKRVRKRRYESMILPAAEKVQAVSQKLDAKAFASDSSESIQELTRAMQSIAIRLQAIEMTMQSCSPHLDSLPQSLVTGITDLRHLVQTTFQCWVKLEPGEVLDRNHGQLHQFIQQVEQEFNRLEVEKLQDVSDEALSDLYAMIGTIRSLIEAMASTQKLMNQIDWKQWSRPRF